MGVGALCVLVAACSGSNGGEQGQAGSTAMAGSSAEQAGAAASGGNAPAGAGSSAGGRTAPSTEPGGAGGDAAEAGAGGAQSGSAGAAGSPEQPLACGTVASGGEAVRVRYRDAHVQYGAACVSEEQHAVCSDGTLDAWSGTYVLESCTPFPPSDCGATEHGKFAERTRYRAASVAYGSSCVSESQQALCQNGALGAWSGSFAFEACAVLPASNCGTVAHGETAKRTRYAASAVPYGSSCVAQEQTAICDDGTLGEWSGTFLFDACSVGPAANCDGTPHGISEERVMYADTTAAYGEVCEKETQTRTCNDGTWTEWTGSYAYEACTVAMPAACGAIPHGGIETRQRYADYSVPFGGSCVSEIQTRVCTNGNFSNWTGSYEQTYCSVQECGTGSLQTRACGLNNRGQQTRPCSGGAWRGFWDDCVDPDVCKDGQAGAPVSCSGGSGWQARTCVAGQFQVTGSCGVCSGKFQDPCLENKTFEACFAASYDGATCSVWNQNTFPPRCELQLNLSGTQCFDIHSQAACRPTFGCTWAGL